MILADLTPTPVQLAAWLACVAAVATGLNQILKLKDRLVGTDEGRKISPQPLEIRQATEFVRKEEHTRQYHEVSLKIDEVKIQLAEQTKVNAIQRKTIYDKIDDVRQETSDALKETRAELNEKIDSMPSAIVTQLLNTKQLWSGPKH